MTMAIGTERYSGFARLLHWTIVALVVAQFAVAWSMPDIHRGTEPVGLVAWHLSIGTAILAIMVVRAVWRLVHREPPPPSSLSPLLRMVSRTTHVILYALLVALPLLGWANASSRGWPITLFGVIPLPPLMATGARLGHTLGDVHGTVAIVLLVVIGLHVLGAAYHLLVVRDRTVQRML
ncbi:cytochrome b [Sphingomonas sp. MMS24-J13]|uniref:cytochrome b n=1 Tax=Sphingomonas sp. MMS24-J13 TaxID=3238686 RepID=UPI00384FA499